MLRKEYDFDGRKQSAFVFCDRCENSAGLLGLYLVQICNSTSPRPWAEKRRENKTTNVKITFWSCIYLQKSVYLAGTGSSKADVLRQFISATPMYLPPFFFLSCVIFSPFFAFASIPPIALLSGRTIIETLTKGPFSARNQSWRVHEPIHGVAQHPIRPKLLEKDPCRNRDIQIKRGRTAGESRSTSTGKPGHVLIRPIWDSHTSDQRK